MADKITKSKIESTFDHYLKAIKQRKAKGWNDVGGWMYDYQSAYGGYAVGIIASKGGGVAQPTGPRRMSAREFYETMWFTIRSLDAAAMGWHK